MKVTPLAGGATTKIPLQSFRLLPDSTQEIAVEVPAEVTGVGRSSVRCRMPGT